MEPPEPKPLVLISRTTLLCCGGICISDDFCQCSPKSVSISRGSENWMTRGKALIPPLAVYPNLNQGGLKRLFMMRTRKTSPGFHYSSPTPIFLNS
jgi:hypothetical protein